MVAQKPNDKKRISFGKCYCEDEDKDNIIKNRNKEIKDEFNFKGNLRETERIVEK